MDTGGPHTLADAIEAAQDADAPVYAMVSNPYAGPAALLAGAVAQVALIQSMRGESRMRRLAEETGGRYYDASKKDAAAGIFTQIEEDLRNLYVVGFYVPEGDRDGEFHQVEIETTRAGVKIRARKGYVAGR